ncbi:hypothetical protein ACFVYE_35680 [Streptomyces sp. NPDC058239]|uniref:hypothetical protein n=1 Tax=Streptomyces sp. NPDC058239 TaxID=3346395 RepID=UPI0036EE7BCC
MANRHETGKALSPDAEEVHPQAERISMLVSLKRRTVLAAVGLCATAGVLASAPTASASTGNWGWPQRSGGVHHGRTALTTFGMECLTAAGCTAQPGTTLTFSPRGGASVINPHNVTFPFIRSDTGAQVGTCATTSYSWIQCTLSSPVSVAYHDKLVGNANGSGVSLDVPYYLQWGTAVGEFSWYDPNGMSDTYPPTETILLVVE